VYKNKERRSFYYGQGPLLPEEQPARRARMIVAASVAANIDIARLDPLFTIEENPHF